jgi:hypothetical protein
MGIKLSSGISGWDIYFGQVTDALMKSNKSVMTRRTED